MSQVVPQPLERSIPDKVFDLPNDDARIAYLKFLGAKNVDPPLPHSTHLRNKVNGRILPWDEMLAEQRDIMECCDVYGNTDPAVWGPQVIDAAGVDTDEKRIALVKAQEVLLSQSAGLTETHRLEDAPRSLSPQPMALPNDAVPYDDIESLIDHGAVKNLIAMLEDK